MTYNQRSPYIVGSPIDSLDRLFGRDQIFHNIDKLLNDGKNFIMLHGQRRIGKSSVLKHIHNFISQQYFSCVHFDLQEFTHYSFSQIIYVIMVTISEQIKLDYNKLKELKLIRDDFDKILNLSQDFLEQVYKHLKHKNLVLLLDEFDVVADNIDNAIKILDFFETLAIREKKLFVIAVVGKYINFMPRLSEKFNAPIQVIGLLDYNSTENLIKQTDEDFLGYASESIEKIFSLSSGHPYLTQVLCNQIFSLARNYNYNNVMPDHIDRVLQEVCSSAYGGIHSIWSQLNREEQNIVFEIAKTKDNLDKIKIIEQFKINGSDQVIQSLISKEFLDIRNNLKMELFYLWVRTNSSKLSN